MNNFMLFHQLPLEKYGKIKNITTTGIVRRRLLDLGMIPGTVVKALMRSPAKDPTAYEIRGTVIALRNSEASNIIIEPLYTRIGDV